MTVYDDLVSAKVLLESAIDSQVTQQLTQKNVNEEIARYTQTLEDTVKQKNVTIDKLKQDLRAHREGQEVVDNEGWRIALAGLIIGFVLGLGVYWAVLS